MNVPQHTIHPYPPSGFKSMRTLCVPLRLDFSVDVCDIFFHLCKYEAVRTLLSVSLWKNVPTDRSNWIWSAWHEAWPSTRQKWASPEVRLGSRLSGYARTGNVMENYPILRQPWKQRKNLCLGGNIRVFVITYNHYALNYARLFKSRIDINHLRGTLISRNLAASRDESCLRGQAKLK